jgi:hypothetical protein
MCIHSNIDFNTIIAHQRGHEPDHLRPSSFFLYAENFRELNKFLLCAWKKKFIQIQFFFPNNAEQDLEIFTSVIHYSKHLWREDNSCSTYTVYSLPTSLLIFIIFLNSRTSHQFHWAIKCTINTTPDIYRDLRVYIKLHILRKFILFNTLAKTSRLRRN